MIFKYAEVESAFPFVLQFVQGMCRIPLQGLTFAEHGSEFIVCGEVAFPWGCIRLHVCDGNLQTVGILVQSSTQKGDPQHYDARCGLCEPRSSTIRCFYQSKCLSVVTWTSFTVAHLAGTRKNMLSKLSVAHRSHECEWPSSFLPYEAFR